MEENVRVLVFGEETVRKLTLITLDTISRDIKTAPTPPSVLEVLRRGQNYFCLSEDDAMTKKLIFSY
jgi:hypothetical protein